MREDKALDGSGETPPPCAEDSAPERPAYIIIRYKMWVDGYGDGATMLSGDVNGLIKDGYQPCGGLYVGMMETSKPYLCQAMYRSPKAGLPAPTPSEGEGPK
jgi:hypothetical protein